jgi:predicted nucleotidyltransferase
MARSVADGFGVFLDRLVPTEAQRTAAAKHRNSVEASIKGAMSVHRFRETGSFHHGTGVRSHSDVDLLVSLNETKPLSSDTALSWVKSALKDSFPYTTVTIRRPAVVIDFAGGDERWEVIPGFLKSRGKDDPYVYDIPGAATGWLDSAPVEHLDYVNEINKTAGRVGGAKSLSRLAKAWKYYNDVPISSFYLEMRAAQYMGTQTNFVAVWDICGLLESLYSHSLAAMNDPKHATGRFHACSSDAKKITALSKLNTAATRARKALDAHNASNPDAAFVYLDLLFGGNFPAR